MAPATRDEDRSPLLDGSKPRSSRLQGWLEVEPGSAAAAPPPPPPGGARAAAGAAPISERQRVYMVCIFCAVASLLYADQNLMAPNLTAIAADFGMDAAARDRYLGGYVAAAFYMVGAPAALLFGYLSDTVNRRNLLFAAVLLGEGPCILTAFVTEYWQLLTLRLLTGISLGGTFPLVFSLLSDLFDPARRAGVSSAVQLATGLGLAVGQGIAGFAGPAIGWRAPFVIVAVPTLALAALMMATTEEPARGGTEAALQAAWAAQPEFEYSERVTWPKVGALLRVRTNLLVILQGLPGCLPWGMLLTFLNDYLAQDRGLSVATATALVLALGAGGAIGVLGGGLVGQWLYNRRKWQMSLFVGGTTLAGVLPTWYLINADLASALPVAFLAALLTGLLSATVGPNMRAAMMNVNAPETRGVALALQTTLDDLGKGLGPALVAAIISRVGRRTAFNIAAAGWIPCGVLLTLTAFTLARDEAAMQRRLKATISRLSTAQRAGLPGEPLGMAAGAALEDGGGGGGGAPARAPNGRAPPAAPPFS